MSLFYSYLQVLSLERDKIRAARKVMECDRLVANFGLQPLDTLGSGSAGPLTISRASLQARSTTHGLTVNISTFVCEIR
jgi:hypothetical protein